MTATRKPTALIILDGWGHRDPAEDNAISNANINANISSQEQRKPHFKIITVEAFKA